MALKSSALRTISPIVLLLLVSCAPNDRRQAPGESSDAPTERNVRAGDSVVDGPGGVIRGKVVDADSGTPIALVRVSIDGTTARRHVVTNSDGQFDFEDIPMGEYRLASSKPGYVTAEYGQSTATSLGHSVRAADGLATSGRLVVKMWEGGSVTGTVVSESGAPLADAAVEALEEVFSSGRRRAQPVQHVNGVKTDDRGQFRISGLRPGDVVMRARLDIGPVTEGGRQLLHAPAYAGSIDLSRATRFSVEARATQTAQIVLPFRPAVEIGGTVVDTAGRPVVGRPSLVRVLETDSLDQLAIAQARADGTFLFLVPDTDRHLTVSVSVAQGPGGAKNPPMYGYLDLAADLQGARFLRVVVKPGSEIRGRVEVEPGGSSTPPPFMIFARPQRSDGSLLGSIGTRATIASGFVVANVFEPSWIETDLATIGEWEVSGVYVDGIDTAERGVEPVSGERLDGIRVVVANRQTRVHGRVLTMQGVIAPEACVLLFSTDDNKWLDARDRFVRTAVAQEDGTYSIVGMPPGNYHLLTRRSIDRVGYRDPELLRRWRGEAITVTVDRGTDHEEDLIVN